MFAILGSGFGLYGYLPALAGAGAQRIVLPQRYRDRFAERPELARFAPRVVWAADDEAALDQAGGAALALRPDDQPGWIRRCLERPRIARLLLEKPLAASPAAAAASFEALRRSATAFRIGYTFRYTAWGQRLLRARAGGGAAPLSVRWHFLAHHYRHDACNWKRQSASGGGALRFYGIHLIALLAELGYAQVRASASAAAAPNECARWRATLAGRGLPDCHLDVDSRADRDGFRVARGDTVYADQGDPFGGGAAAGGGDPRVGVLSQLCGSLWQDGGAAYARYEAALRLWARVEENNVFRLVRAGDPPAATPQGGQCR